MKFRLRRRIMAVERGEFEFHCSLGGISFELIILTLAAGFLVSGRFGRLSSVSLYPIYKLMVVYVISSSANSFSDY